MKRALFLDRDGVICQSFPRGEYLVRKEQFQLLEGIEQLVDHASERGFLVLVATNQPAVSKKLLHEDELARIHQGMLELLPRIRKVYCCPHTDADGCACRKPKPGMLLEGARDFGIDLASSFFVGDSDKDVNAGRVVGCQTVFLKNEFNTDELARCSPHHVVETLHEIRELLK